MDRRLTPFSGRVAALGLRGQVAAETYREGEPWCVRGNPFLLATPGGARDRQLLAGDPVRVYDRRDGWVYLQADKDGYCGWIPADALAPPEPADARVAVRSTWLCPAPTVRQPALGDLHLGSRVERLGECEAGWARVRCGGVSGWLPEVHLKPLAEPEPDPVAVARRYLGTPYLWAGNTGFGIDCSGLVQAALLACDLACPGDSDLQEASVGRPLAPDEPEQAGDLCFWPGHVAMVAEPGRIIHATGHAMQVVLEPLAGAIARIAAAGQPLRSRRRP